MASVMNRVTVTRAPKDGQDATAYVVTPSVTAVRRDQFGTPSVDEFTVTSLKKVGDNTYEEFPPELLLSYERKIEDSDIGQWIAFSNPSADNIPTVTIGDDDTEYTIQGRLADGTVVCTVTVLVVKDGSDGSDGSNGHDILPRGPRDWADVSVGETFYDGSTPVSGSNIYIRDIVRHNGYYWLCILGHARSSDNEPQLGSCNWRRFQSWDLVATQLLLAEDAVIENGIIRNLATDIKPNKRVEIRQASNDIKIFDASGNPVSRMSGDTYTPAELFGAGGDTTPSSVGTISTRLCYARQYNDTTSDWGGTYLQTTLAASPGLLVGKLRVKVAVTNTMVENAESGSGGGTDPDTGLAEMVRLPEVTLQLWVGDTVVWSHMGAIADTTVDFSYGNNAASVPVKLVVTCRKGTRCTGTWTASVYAALSDIRVDSRRNQSLIFKEGLAVGASSSQYLMAMTDPNGIMAIKGRSGAAGFMCYKDNLYLRFAQGGWQRLSAVTQGSNVLLKLTACTEPQIDTTTT